MTDAKKAVDVVGRVIYDGPWAGSGWEVAEAMDLLREMADKATPEPPHMVEDGLLCPGCTAKIKMHDSFCRWCGKAIDWTGYED